ncbi:MAG: hypothetical protein VCD00_08680 [Candidatus Hydrogenedentota bacterium]
MALQNANGTDNVIVNREEMLAIGEEFGLNVVDLVRASEEIEASREDTQASSRAMYDFKLHVFCYLAGVTGIFLVNLVTNSMSSSPNVWWFLFAMVAYAPVVAVHGFIAKSDPNLASSLIREEETAPPAEPSAMSR